MGELKRHCLALDLKKDPELIRQYEQFHRAVWPDILQSIREAGVEKLEIYRVENRLFMIMDVNDTFSFEQKKAMDKSNPRVQEWETLMWKFQQALPTAAAGEKWILMDKIFQL